MGLSTQGSDGKFVFSDEGAESGVDVMRRYLDAKLYFSCYVIRVHNIGLVV